MRKPLLAVPFALWLVAVPGLTRSPISAEIALPLLESTKPAEICLMPDARPGYQAGGSGSSQRERRPEIPPDWPGKNAIGGDLRPARTVYDPHPVFNGMAVDSQNGLVVMSDQNNGGLLVYDVRSGSNAPITTEPRNHISSIGGFLAGVAVDPIRREIFTASNDGAGLSIWSYDWTAQRPRPVRDLSAPHQAWGVSLDLKRDELAVTSQQYQGISIYQRTASGADRPVRTIRGDKTMLADPHGVYLDGANDEVFAANHGNWTEMRSYSADGPPLLVGEYIPGRFEPPSIRVYKASADGNVAPIRTIQGATSKLAWPMGIDVSAEGELAVANYGSHEILIYGRTAKGDVAPVRSIGGDKTRIQGPVAVGFDQKNNEIWAANYGDHTAVVFDRKASGNVPPKRIIRNAPAGTPTTGFTNASAAAYDSKRDQLLVPN